MKAIAERLWTEPALIVAILIACLNAALLYPDWQAMVASVVASLGGGVAVRQSVRPLAQAARRAS
jgi:hypothetical protein